jgi:cytochrome d ubiquinol oxidase subunit II
MRLVLAVALATALVTASTFALEPRILARFRDAPAALALPAIAVGSLLAIRPLAARGRERGAFAASCAFLAGMLASVAFGQFPLVLPSSTDPARALTANGAASDAGGLAIGLAWWVPGMMLAAGYSVGVHWMFRGKVSGGEGEEHY